MKAENRKGKRKEKEGLSSKVYELAGTPKRLKKKTE